MTSVYSQYRIIEPSKLPLTLAEAKNYLKIDFAEDDELLTKIIEAATQKFEKYTSRALIQQMWRVTYRQLARISLTLPIRPALQLKRIQCVSFDGVVTHFNLADAGIDTKMGELHFYTFPYGYFVKVNYLAGYGTNPEDIPADIKTTLLNHIAHMYENRSLNVRYDLAIYDEFRNVRI